MRLGEIDAILLSHVHGDHLGDAHQPAANAGSCASPDFSVSTTPESNTVRIAYVIDEMVQPNAVIPSHANEEATRDGELLPDTRTAAFAEAVSVPVHLPLSGRTLTFDGQGRCIGSC